MVGESWFVVFCWGARALTSSEGSLSFWLHFCFVFLQPDTKFSSCFTYICFIAVGTWDFVHTFWSLVYHYFVFWVYQNVSGCIVWFRVTWYIVFSHDPSNRLRSSIYVGNHHWWSRYRLVLLFLFLLLLLFHLVSHSIKSPLWVSAYVGRLLCVHFPSLCLQRLTPGTEFFPLRFLPHSAWYSLPMWNVTCGLWMCCSCFIFELHQCKTKNPWSQIPNNCLAIIIIRTILIP